MHDEIFDWAAIIDLYRHANLSINSRLHSGVLAMSAHVPNLYIASNIKYNDLLVRGRVRLLPPRPCLGAHFLRRPFCYSHQA